MIPRLGRIFPFIIAVLGILDTFYTWPQHKYVSSLLAIITIYFIYIMFKDHSAVPPKHSLYFLFIPIVIAIIILVATWFVWFFK